MLRCSFALFYFVLGVQVRQGWLNFSATLQQWSVQQSSSAPLCTRPSICGSGSDFTVLTLPATWTGPLALSGVQSGKITVLNVPGTAIQLSGRLLALVSTTITQHVSWLLAV